MGKFRFKLTNQNTNDYIVLDDLNGYDVPNGWDSRKPSIERDTLYHGAFTSFTVGLTFIFKGFEWLEDIFTDEGILASVLIEFEEKDNQTKQWSIQDTGVIDFTTRNIVSTIEGGGVEYNILDTGFKQKVRNREDTEISYNSQESLDGDVIPEPVYKETEILGIQIADSGIVSNVVEVEHESTSFSDYSVILGIDANYNYPFKNVISRSSVTPIQFTSDDFFYYTNAGGVIKVDYNINLDFFADNPSLINEWVLNVYLGGINIFSSSVPESSKNITGSETFILNENEGIALYIEHQGQTAVGSFIKTKIKILADSTLDSTFSDTFSPTSTLNAFPYEIFQRLKEAITGDTSPIDAPILNRPDTIDPSVEYGKYSKYALMNGLLIRNFTILEANMSLKLKNFYTEFDKIFNIGLDFDGDNFTIRDKKDFYTQDLVHEFGKESVVSDSIEKSLSLDYYYSDAVVGYVSRTNENIGGLQEYNSTAYYNTALSIINNTLELTSDIIGNAYTFEEVRRLQKISSDGKNNETTDTSFDQDLFILDTVPDVDKYKQRTTEGFDTISGLPLVTTPINLSITPAQNLDKWGWMLLVGVQKYASTPIKFNKAEIKQNQEDGTPVNVSTTIGTKTVTENSPIPFSDFDPPIFAGTLIDVQVIANLDIYKAVKANPYGLIGVYNEVEKQMNYGWLLSFSLGATDKDTTMTLIEAKSVSFVLKSWLWESGEKILWESGEFIAIED